jgi:hypothetical protein
MFFRAAALSKVSPPTVPVQAGVLGFSRGNYPTSSRTHADDVRMRNQNLNAAPRPRRGVAAIELL